MIYEKQMEWLDARFTKDYTWATRELDIRRQAHDVMSKLYSDDEPDRVKVLVWRPGAGSEFASSYEEVVIYKSQVLRVGGLEGLLVIEEILRRACGLSREADLEERLARVRGAL